ncbi:glycosyltransferase [Bacillus aerolatus]|uniref:Glycosyltransferase n=1 Tax=Bacillus aerolatus TaxID=2653354 RepID=A0A6I1FIF7_9BACI|nr:glycosyltransferase family 2 protein [Bacillus aerolatus]KAB7708180.1 glycosyltransferase [Bacillus aerolatus]
MSKVSVIVPIYNAEKKLGKCIKSILNQTFNDFELILVNDGSIDNSLHICRGFEREDRRIKVIDKKNEGCIAARREGIENSSSDYIMFVDADDWIDKKSIETLYNETINNDLDITVCNMYKVLGNGALFKKKNDSVYFSKDKIYSGEEIKKELVPAYFHGHPFPSSLCAKLYKKELIAKSGNYLDRIYFLGEDLFYNLEMFLKAKRVKVISHSLYFYSFGGFTSKYMPHLFEDMINGYKIQKEVINEYFVTTKQEHYNGISIMLLNTFKTCLCNLFGSKLSESNIKKSIAMYISNEDLIGTLSNEGSIRYFPKEYLSAIREKDINFLYQLGKDMYKKQRPRKMLLSTISKFQGI